MSQPPLTASEVLTTAAGIVSGDRQRTHGDKLANFARIANYWNARLAEKLQPGKHIDELDVGWMMVFVKAAREQSGAYNPDNYVDAAGYSGCLGEIAALINPNNGDRT